MPAMIPFSAPGRWWRLVLLCAVLTLATVGFAGRAAAQVDHGVTLVKADLLADTTAVVPGRAFTVGLRLKMAPHWHTYWQYSGDAGLPTKIDWQLPAGYKAGPIQWPVPEKIVSPGDIINYGYDDEVMLLTEITSPAQPAPGGEVTLQAKATWLVCADKCIPGQAELSLKLSTGGDAQAANAEVFAKYRALLPTQAQEMKDQAILNGKKLSLMFRGSGPLPDEHSEFFPLPGETAEIGHPSAVTITSSEDRWIATASVIISSDPKDADQIGGVWVFVGKDGKKSAFSVVPQKPRIGESDQTSGQLPPATRTNSAPGQGGDGNQSLSPGQTSNVATPASSLWHFLLLGFLGGLILNVMPCVLPVISLKLFSFVKQANESPARVFRLGLAYAAGVFAWFLGFAGLVVAAKAAGGRQIGYSFQLQNPWFLLALIAVSFVFALNLLGVFEFILPGGITNAAGERGSPERGLFGRVSPRRAGHGARQRLHGTDLR